MKKHTRCFLLLILSILLLFSATACRQEEVFAPANASELWNKIDETMNGVESMEVIGSVQASFYSGGYLHTIQRDSYALATKETHYAQSNSTLACEELSLEQTTQIVEAYYNGKMYTAIHDGVYNQKLCSNLSHEQYDQIQMETPTDEIDILDCTNAEFTREADDSWKLQFSGYTKKAIDKMIETSGIGEDVLGAPVVDMDVSLSADANFRVQQMVISFSFATKTGDTQPQLTITAVYSGYQAAVFDETKLKPEEYTQVEDVRILNAVKEAIAQRQNATAGKFTLSINNSYETKGQTSSSVETDSVTYGRKNGAYYYSITSLVDGKAFEILYQNEEQSVTTDGQSHTAAQSEEEAKLFIDGLINTAKFTSNSVTDIRKLEEGTYVLTSSSLDASGYIPAMSANGVEVTSVSQECIVVFADGKLMKLESKVTLNGIQGKEPMVMIGHTIVTFDDQTAE